MTVEDITEPGDEFAGYSVYHESKFYRVYLWESLDPEREGYAEVEKIEDYHGKPVTDEELRAGLTSAVMAFRRGN